MITISISEEHRKFVDEYSEKQTIGGFSNLAQSDLKKASRGQYQMTGIYGELAHYIYRYGSYDKLRSLLDYKFKNLRPNNIGDNGFDDVITYKGHTRLIDIKTSHCEHENRISQLNMIIPAREYHKQMIYIAAFTIGEDRRNVDKVILKGWSFNEDVVEKWRFDNSKWCVPISKLRPMKNLEQYFNAHKDS